MRSQKAANKGLDQCQVALQACRLPLAAITLPEAPDVVNCNIDLVVCLPWHMSCRSHEHMQGVSAATAFTVQCCV